MTAPFAVLLTCLLTPVLTAQGGEPVPHIAWQRNLDDALAVQKLTGLPLLIAVNMNGEVFNDRFRTDTYVDATFVESTRGYVCVVASPDRHTDRDYDSLGRRVECPFFPGCTCSEHINIEPELYRRYFGGKRNAPRHVAVSPDGTILLDRFLDASMQTAVDAIAKHRGTPKPEQLGPTEDLEQLFSRRDSVARSGLEELYRKGDFDVRRKILEGAATATNDPVDLLRMALREDDDTLFGYAARALARRATKDSLIDIEDALARLDNPEVIKVLLARLGEIGSTDKAAGRLFSHFDWTADEGFPQPWSNEWSPAKFEASSRDSVEAELDRCEAILKQQPEDEVTRLQLGTAQLALGEILAATGAKGPEFWFDDAILSAKKVRGEALQAEAQALLAAASWPRGDTEAARKASIVAMSTAKSDRKPDAWLAGRLLGVVLQTTAQVAYGKAQEDATASLRAEIVRTELALQLVLNRNQLSEGACLAGIGLLEYGGLRHVAAEHLQDLVKAFPASAAVHERWRNRLLIDLGAEGMRVHYAKFVAKASDAPAAQWFTGYANLVAAEQHVRDARSAEARSAYDTAIDAFAQSAAGNESFADSANHYAVLGLGGRALLRHLAGDGEGAVADLLRAAALRPASLDEADGLERKPRALASRIARELAAAGKTALSEQLAAIVQ